MQRINLLDVLPKPFQPPLPAALMAKILGGFTGFLLLISVILYWHASHLSTELKQTTAKQSQLVNQLSKIKEQYPSITENQRLKSDIQTLKARLIYQQKLMEVLKEQFTTKPFSVYFEIFARQTPIGMWLTRIIINNPKAFITIVGQTEKTSIIATFVKGLDDEPILDGTQFQTFKIISDTNKQTSTASTKTTTENNKIKQTQSPVKVVTKLQYPEFILSTLPPDDALEALGL